MGCLRKGPGLSRQLAWGTTAISPPWCPHTAALANHCAGSSCRLLGCEAGQGSESYERATESVGSQRRCQKKRCVLYCLVLCFSKKQQQLQLNMLLDTSSLQFRLKDRGSHCQLASRIWHPSSGRSSDSPPPGCPVPSAQGAGGISGGHPQPG